MSTVIGILVALTACAIISFGLFYVRFRAHSAAAYAEAASAFYDAAKPLATDEETPEEILSLIFGLNKTITNNSCAWHILRYLNQDRWWKDKLSGASELSKVAAEFLHRRPELEGPYREMMVNWFLAITALAPFPGHLARAAMTEPGLIQAATRAAKKIETNGDEPHFPSTMEAA